MHDSDRILALLLLASGIAIVVLVWRLGVQRRAAEAGRVASERENERQAAAHARSLRAAGGEREAAALLGRYGYTVIDRQVPGSWTVLADGEALKFDLRADYLVVREGRRYIAEVKTGRVAPRLSHGPTRRQLLEYAAAFDVEGVILVDADSATIVHVDMAPVAATAMASARRRGGRVSLAVFALAIVVSFSMGVLAGTIAR